MSPVACGVQDGQVVISSRETAMKVKNLRRDPRASLCVISDGFFGDWVQLDGTADDPVAPRGDGAAGRVLPLALGRAPRLGRVPEGDDARPAPADPLTVERAGPNVSG